METRWNAALAMLANLAIVSRASWPDRAVFAQRCCAKIVVWPREANLANG